MDFVKIKEKIDHGKYTILPVFVVRHSKDILIKGKTFYAIYDESKGLWSTDEYDVVKLVDNELLKYRDEKYGDSPGIDISFMQYYDTGLYEKYKKFVSQSPTSNVQLDSNLTFANSEVRKEDYVSKRLPYDLQAGDYSAFDKLISTLYEPDERLKIEWAIGSIVSGDSKSIQKFLVLYGDAGSGKSTILNVIEQLFEGYCATFNAKDLGSSSSSFSTAAFKNNPLVAIQHDGDLSRIEDNTKLNSIISHEYITINEKYQAGYPMKVNSFLFMGTNKPVKITDAKSGIIRRLIDVHPSGNKLPPKEYQACMTEIQFELGAIAQHCLDIYRDLGKHYYDAYVPIDMMYKTDVFFNFVEDSYMIFEKEDGTTLKAAYSLYKEYCESTGLPAKMPQYKFREELKDYFDFFEERIRLDDGKQVRSYYHGFKTSKFQEKELKKDSDDHQVSLVLDSTDSIFDRECADYPAQYANVDEHPTKKWAKVGTKLSDLDTTKLHYVKMIDIHHIIVDFDLKDADGNKSLEKNLEAASKWPPTYAETSKSGSGIHLHYIYDGDPTKLCKLYAPDIEIKVYSGDSSLRRKLVRCNNLPIAHISSGLPVKKGDKMVNFDTVKDEKHLRSLIRKNLRKEIHPSTKSSIDFIKKILDDAYASGMKYDISDMKQAVLTFAANSTHQSEYCIKLVTQMQFKSEDITDNSDLYVNDTIVFYDVEVFPNLLLINYKFRGQTGPCVRMINPSPQEVEEFLKFKLVGFNCRRYDNHICYARMMGYSLEQLYHLSQSIVNGERNAMFGSAYNLSYTDVYDFCAKKQSLKKWEIEIGNAAKDPNSKMDPKLREFVLSGVKHHELGLPWDQPVPEELWPKVAEYCDDDVYATEATFEYNFEDFEAREALAEIAGGCPNDTNNMLSGKLIFGNDRNPQTEFVYTDLSTGISSDGTYNEFNKFEGYTFDHGKSIYKGIEVGEGGCVIADPGIYRHVKTFDVSSMHPHSVIALNLFGDKYTGRFKDLVDARIAIKHGDKEAIKTLFGGAFARFADASKEVLGKLAKALKIVINSVYGLTAAHFPNLFRDERNIDNIVAKRGALFMVNLKEEVEKLGAHVVHIKTDSIKIDNPSPEVEQFIYDYGKKYGYSFEIEAEYEKMCLVNNAVYIAFERDEEKVGWTATGAQFAVPFVFKSLFSHEAITFADLCQTIAVQNGGELNLDMNESLPEGEHDYQFVGKVGQFCPVLPGIGGGQLFRVKEDKYYAASGTKGYRWLEADRVEAEVNGTTLDDYAKVIDISYYQKLADEAIETISEFGDFKAFVA